MSAYRKFIVTTSLYAAFAMPGVASAMAVSGQGTWESTLQGRDLDGNLATFEAYYDTSLNITWLANANAYVNSTTTWVNANAWVASLNPFGSNITGWRLPTVNPVDGTTADDTNFSYIGTEDQGYNVSAPGTLYAGSKASEMAHMFYSTLGNKSYCNPSTSTVSHCSGPQSGWGLTNTGPFSNLAASGDYWSATEYAPDTSLAWFFSFTGGDQSNLGKTSPSKYAWAVHPGDVGAAVVPLPAAMWLFGSGLLGLVGVGRKPQRSCSSLSFRA